ncbi:MAG: glycosyltransferase [Hyphomicrobium sp.]|nr:glycosyltransferase [Hyphomicrobium sp.]
MAARISVITASLNRKQMLQRAIESVVQQGLDRVEHIIIDAKSADGTLEMLGAYRHLIVVSEPDRGVYEAWNKGLRRTHGDLICFLNSDDEIPPGAFAQARAAFADDPMLDMVSGPVEVYQPAGNGKVRKSIIDDPRMLGLRHQDVGPGTPLPNGRYLTPRLMARVGFFDERYALVSDRDFFLRVLLANPRNVTVPAPLYRYHYHDQSLTFAGAKVARRLSEESLRASRSGLLEARDGKLRRAYARWHAWAAFYMSLLEARAGHLGAATRVAASAFVADPIWPLRLPGQVLRHFGERPSRRGRAIGEG